MSTDQVAFGTTTQFAPRSSPFVGRRARPRLVSRGARLRIHEKRCGKRSRARLPSPCRVVGRRRRRAVERGAKATSSSILELIVRVLICMSVSISCRCERVSASMSCQSDCLNVSLSCRHECVSVSVSCRYMCACVYVPEPGVESEGCCICSRAPTHPRTHPLIHSSAHTNARAFSHKQGPAHASQPKYGTPRGVMGDVKR